MFKPRYDICVCHGLKRLIVVKKGFCHEGNEKYKSDRRRTGGNVGSEKTESDRTNCFQRSNIANNLRRSGRPKVNVGKRKTGNNKDFRRVSSGMDEEKTSFNGGLGKKKKQPLRKKRKALQYRRKPTGESEVFKEIGQERGPHSQIYPHKWIDLNDARCYSHILTKQSYPGYRKDKRNIILKTPEEHTMWETQRDRLKDLPEWQWIFELEQTLKREYYEKSAITKK